MNQIRKNIISSKDLTEEEKQLILEQLKNSSPEIFDLLVFNYQTMCAIKMAADNEKLVLEMLKDCMEKTIKIINQYQY